MVIKRTRLTAEQKIVALEAKIKAIKEAERNAAKVKKKELTRESEGMEALLAMLEQVASANKVKKPTLIRAIAKLTRSGLKFIN
jgi:3-methyladenine DNA glycosylase Tag